jgi:hypothetical protein
MKAKKTFYALDVRLETFKEAHVAGTRSRSKKNAVKWPHKSPSAGKMATAGFYFDPSPDSLDNATCFMCHHSLDGWESDDDPVKEHYSHAQHCSWAQLWAKQWEQYGDDVVSLDEYPEFNPHTEQAIKSRFDTFTLWPHESKKGWRPVSRNLALAGFFYNPVNPGDDGVSCPYCDMGLDGWEPKDDPIAEHRSRNPNCLFFTTSKLDDNRINTNKRSSSEINIKPVEGPNLLLSIFDDENEDIKPPKRKKKTQTNVNDTKLSQKSSSLVKQEANESLLRDTADGSPHQATHRFFDKPTHGSHGSTRRSIRQSTGPDESILSGGRQFGGEFGYQSDFPGGSSPRPPVAPFAPNLGIPSYGRGSDVSARDSLDGEQSIHMPGGFPERNRRVIRESSVLSVNVSVNQADDNGKSIEIEEPNVDSGDDIDHESIMEHEVLANEPAESEHEDDIVQGDDQSAEQSEHEGEEIGHTGNTIVPEKHTNTNEYEQPYDDADRMAIGGEEDNGSADRITIEVEESNQNRNVTNLMVIDVEQSNNQDHISVSDSEPSECDGDLDSGDNNELEENDSRSGPGSNLSRKGIPDAAPGLSQKRISQTMPELSPISENWQVHSDASDSDQESKQEPIEPLTRSVKAITNLASMVRSPKTVRVETPRKSAAFDGWEQVNPDMVFAVLAEDNKMDLDVDSCGDYMDLTVQEFMKNLSDKAAMQLEKRCDMLADMIEKEFQKAIAYTKSLPVD